MKLRKIVALLLTASISASLLVGCSGSTSGSKPEQKAETSAPETTSAPAEVQTAAPAETQAPSPEAAIDTANQVSITDVIGRTVTLPAPAKKVVGTHNPTMNQAIILGGGGKYIAGFGNKKMAGELYKLVFPELENDVPQIGKGKDINMESVIALKPDLVLLPERFKDSVEVFEGAGLNVAVVLPNVESFDTVRESLMRVATLLGEEQRAKSILAVFDEKINNATEVASKATSHPKMLYTGGSSMLSVANGIMLQSQIMETVGGINVAKDVPGKGDFIEVTAEEIIGWNPEIIYIPAFADYTVDDVLNNPALSSVQAIKDKKVFQTPSKLEPWDYPTPSCCLSVAWFLNNLYPDLYTKDQLLKDSQDYYSLIYGQTFTAEQLGLK